MYQFLSGLLVMGYAVCGTFFIKYWKVTHDRLFSWFALAFWILAMQRILLVVSHANKPTELNEHEIPYYVTRLAAYLLIIFGIIDKNRSIRKK